MLKFLKPSILPVAIALLLLTGGRVSAQCTAAGRTDVEFIDKEQVTNDAQVAQFVARLNTLYGIESEYSYYNDVRAPNCYSLPQDGQLYLGVNFIKTCGSELELAYVLAHQYGHLHQFIAGGTSLFGNGHSKRDGELQADFMAGYALTALGMVNATNYNTLLAKAWLIGDPLGAWQNPEAHGSVKERSTATRLGVQHTADGLEPAYIWFYENFDQVPRTGASAGAAPRKK